MKQKTKNLEIESKQNIQIIDITQEVDKIIADSKIEQGIACIFTKHTTTALRVNENEKRLLEDMRQKLEEIAPTNKNYLHDDISLRKCPPNEPLNGHSHLKSLILNTSETILIQQGKLCLGKWQSLLVFELDGPRKRELNVHIFGE